MHAPLILIPFIKKIYNSFLATFKDFLTDMLYIRLKIVYPDDFCVP